MVESRQSSSRHHSSEGPVVVEVRAEAADPAAPPAGDPDAARGAASPALAAEPDAGAPLGAPGTEEPASGIARPGEPTEDRSAVEQLTLERDQLRDRLLRTAAEFENYRKRIDRERREFTDLAAADLLASLLPVVDDLERALGVETPPEAEPYRKGVELIHRQLTDLLARRGVTPIQAVGAEFDPRFHEAILHEESPGRRPGEVTGELRRGYLIGDRLLRASMVKVARS